MKGILNLVVVLVASFSVSLSVVDVAEAKRLGGSTSFGSKFSHSKSVKKNSADGKPANTAQQLNADRKQQFANKGGLMGLLGGLAIGGVLGALFFGGAFENINFMDILLFGLIAFLLYKFFAARGRQVQPAAAGYPGGTVEPGDYNPQRQSVGESSSGAATNESPASDSWEGATLDELRGEIPKKFDQKRFIEGAKACYERLQKAWDNGDLAEIRQFSTDHVFAEIQDQIRARGDKTKTEVLRLDAELLSVQELDSRTEAIVLFDVELREDGEATNAKELWHFVQPPRSNQPTWYLDGIQQVES